MERAWDLFYGREGQESLQMSTPIHLRAQLSGTAYEAVRKIDHSKLRTKDGDGKATDEGMRLLLNTLKDSLAQEAPVRTQELFLAYFYSPQVWRKNQESMAQYIVRRELSFTRLQEASSMTQLSDNLKSMLLLLFSGLDLKEQQSILASVNNDYDYKKISHALRMQYPTAASTRAVVRRDFLGSNRGGSTPFQSRPRWKGLPRKQQVFAAQIEEDEVFEEEESFLEENAVYDEDYDEEHGAIESEDDAFETIVSELTAEDLESGEVAEALATIAQHRGQFKKKFIQRPTSSTASASQGSSQSVPFRAQGDITFDQKAKDQRKAAVSFLKSVTQCTACGQRHWVGDPGCPKGSKKGAGKAHKGKGAGKKRSPSGSSSPKKVSSNYFVLSDRIESDDEHVSFSKEALLTTEVPENAKVPENDQASENVRVPVDEPAHSELFDPAGFYGNDYPASFTDSLMRSASTC